MNQIEDVRTATDPLAPAAPPMDTLLKLDDEVLMGVLVARAGDAATWRRGAR